MKKIRDRENMYRLVSTILGLKITNYNIAHTMFMEVYYERCECLLHR
jgi:hypothetical protein